MRSPKMPSYSILRLLPVVSGLVIPFAWSVAGHAQIQTTPLPELKIQRVDELVNQQNSEAVDLAPVEAVDPTPTEFPDVIVQRREEITVPAETGAVISEIQIRYLDKRDNEVDGNTKSNIITREFELQPGDVYDEQLARDGLERLLDLDIIRRANISLEPAADPSEVVMVIDVVERGSFFFNLSRSVDHPSTLFGPLQPPTVLPGSNRSSSFNAGTTFGFRNLGGTDQNLVLGVEAGSDTLGFDLRFTNPGIGDNVRRWGYSLNYFHSQTSELPVYDNGDRDVDLPNGDAPWVHRVGGGIEVFRPFTDDFKGAFGLSYQQVSVREDIYTTVLAPRDGDRDRNRRLSVLPDGSLAVFETESGAGNRLTFNDEGVDDLLSFSFAGEVDKRDTPILTTRGSHFLFRSDQFIPVGEASILSNRLAASYTVYAPLPFIGFSEGPRTFVFNVQGGTTIGALPPYDAFSLGGSSSVRGYDKGEVGSGRSFIQATAEYRYPIADLRLFRQDINLRGTFFVDFATDLGSGDTVPGEPAEARDKPGSGLGYGLGLRAETGFGPLRAEFGLTDQGDSQFIFTVGDRF